MKLYRKMMTYKFFSWFQKEHDDNDTIVLLNVGCIFILLILIFTRLFYSYFDYGGEDYVYTNSVLFTIPLLRFIYIVSDYYLFRENLVVLWKKRSNKFNPLSKEDIAIVSFLAFLFFYLVVIIFFIDWSLIGNKGFFNAGKTIIIALVFTIYMFFKLRIKKKKRIRKK